MQITPNLPEAYKLLHDGILAFSRAEQEGMRIDVDYCIRQKARLDKKVSLLENKIRKTKFYSHWERIFGAKSNPDSNWQLAHMLYAVKKIAPTKVTPSGKGATDDEALSQIDLPEIKWLLEMRKLKKVRDTYLDAFLREQVDGYLHPFFNLHTVKTFRSSSERINFQNIPKRDKEAMEITRKAIFPKPGHQLFEVDYSGIEVRISTCYHHDPAMRKYIEDPTTDMHGDMASQIFVVEDFERHKNGHGVLRNAAKNGFVFPQFYGDYYVNCTENMAIKWCGLSKGKWKSGEGIEFNDSYISDHLINQGINSYSKFESHVQKIEEDFWYRRFKVYSKWKERWWEKYQEDGYVSMYTGFKCGGIMRRNECINIPIQGSAFHCLLWSFIQIDRISREENWKSRIIGQIHDAMVLDVHPDELDIVAAVVHRVTCEDLPKHWTWINVPLEIEAEVCPVDGSWNEKQDYKF
jgi:DNA polymerase I-like protein with 3'-5' exonuclease and polymerase domains